MNHLTRNLIPSLVALWLLAGFSLAQDLTPLELYDSAMGHLENSLRTLSDNPTDSEASLNLAADAFRLLSQRTRSGSLREGVSDTFSQARTAILRRSVADFEVRLAIIRGGLHRILYELALYDAATEPEQAQAYAARLGRDLNLSAERQEVLAQVVSWRQLQAELEAGIGERALAELEGLLALAETDREAATLRLARAYGLFIPVQDSTRTSENTTDAFVEAFSALFEGDQAALTGSLAVLELQMVRLSEASYAPESSAAPASNGSYASAPDEAPLTQATNEPFEAGVVAVAFAEAAAPLPAPAAEAAPEPTTPEPVTPEPAAEAAPLAAPEPAAETAQAATTLETATQQAATQQAAIQEAAALELELAAYPLAAPAMQRLMASFAASDYRSVAEVVTALQARSARLVAASQQGLFLEARAHLSAIRSDYALFLAPILEQGDRELSAATIDLLRHLESAPELRLQDAATVASQLEAVSGALAGQAPSMLQGVDARTATLWPGWVRAGVLVFLALLAFIPLYLLNLAFGGGNRNWRWVSVALFLLLLPLIFEGAASAAALVAEFTSVPELYLLAAFSPFGSLTAQAAWALVMLLAILFATIGLRGICAQFGLLGKPKVTTQAGLQPSQKVSSLKQTVEEPYPARVATKPGPSGAIDWDDD